MHQPILSPFFFGSDVPVGKYGPKFNSDTLVFSLAPLTKYQNKCWTTSYWSTIKTVQKHVLTWELALNRKAYYPLVYEIAASIILFLIENYSLSPATLYQYVSALKALHVYQGYSLEGLNDPRTKLLLKGYKNIVRTLETPVNKRMVMHWETLQIFGHELCFVEYLSYEDKQCMWTVAVFSFWVSSRYGDFMPGNHGVVHEKLLTWERIQMIDDDHASVYLHIPKNDREGAGEVKDMVRFKDKVYCPMHNLEKLYAIRAARRPVASSEPVFLLQNDKLVTMSFTRKVMAIMDKYYPPGAGKLTCHSARAGLACFMAHDPAFFTEKEIMALGNWKGPSHRFYSNRTGVGQARTLRKLASRYNH